MAISVTNLLRKQTAFTATVDVHPNSVFMNTEFIGKADTAFTGKSSSHNFVDRIAGKFVPVKLFHANYREFRTAGLPSFSHLVGLIGRDCSEKHVCKVATQTVIAFVAHKFVPRLNTCSKIERQPIGTQTNTATLRSEPLRPVTTRDRTADPRPTFIRPAHIDTTPKCSDVCRRQIGDR